MNICNSLESSRRWLYDVSFIFPLDGDDSVHLQAGYPLSRKPRSRPPPRAPGTGQAPLRPGSMAATLRPMYTVCPSHAPPYTILCPFQCERKKRGRSWTSPEHRVFQGPAAVPQQQWSSEHLMKGHWGEWRPRDARRGTWAPLPRPLRRSHSLSWDLHVLRRGAFNEQNEDVSLCHVAS